MDSDQPRQTCPTDPMCPNGANVPSQNPVNHGGQRSIGHVGHVGHVPTVPALFHGLFVDYVPPIAAPPLIENDVNDAPDNDLNSTVDCGFCGSKNMRDDVLGLRCDACGHLVWIDVDGALRRVTWHDHDICSMAPGDLPECSTCGRLCDTQTCDESWHCSRCDVDADQRRQRTERLLRDADRIRRQNSDISTDVMVDDDGTLDDAAARLIPESRSPKPVRRGAF